MFALPCITVSKVCGRYQPVGRESEGSARGDRWRAGSRLGRREEREGDEARGGERDYGAPARSAPACTGERALSLVEELDFCRKWPGPCLQLLRTFT